MAKGYYLVQGDKTTCGGRILSGAEDHALFGKALARDRDKVSCGKHSGIYMIAGGIEKDTIHGRKMAGTLDSISTCPCRAHFIPSMMQDSYEKGDEASIAHVSLDMLMAKLRAAYTKQVAYKDIEEIYKHPLYCTHTDGAIQVAEYIVEEIKRNVKSRTAELIRYLIDEETLKQRQAEWEQLPFHAKMVVEPPESGLLTAMGIWYQAVKTGAKWDHKPKIRKLFKSVAVTRPLQKKEVESMSHYHKFKSHDYFYDVWSNIHYGYVGLSIGFSESLLLKGSSWEQHMTPGAMGDDTLDDITSIKIGFKLYHQHGKYAETLTFNNILDELENASDNQLYNSREKHWCWNTNNPNHIEE